MMEIRVVVMDVVGVDVTMRIYIIAIWSLIILKHFLGQVVLY